MESEARADTMRLDHDCDGADNNAQTCDGLRAERKQVVDKMVLTSYQAYYEYTCL